MVRITIYHKSGVLMNSIRLTMVPSDVKDLLQSKEILHTESIVSSLPSAIEDLKHYSLLYADKQSLVSLIQKRIDMYTRFLHWFREIPTDLLPLLDAHFPLRSPHLYEVRISLSRWNFTKEYEPILCDLLFLYSHFHYKLKIPQNEENTFCWLYY